MLCTFPVIGKGKTLQVAVVTVKNSLRKIRWKIQIDEIEKSKVGILNASTYIIFLLLSARSYLVFIFLLQMISNVTYQYSTF